MKQKRIKSQNISFSSLFQFLILVLGLFLAVILTDRAQKYIGRAGTSPKPKEVKISNITETSFVVSWITEKPAIGAVILFDNGKESIFFDDRNITYTSNSLFSNHYVTLKNLTPGKNYAFLIQSGKEKFLNDGKNYEVFLPSSLTITPPPPVFLYGTLIDKNNQPQRESLVYLIKEGYPPLSFLTDKNGNFIFNLNNFRNQSGYFSPKAGEKVTLFSYDEENNRVEKGITLIGTDQSLGNLKIEKDKGISLIGNSLPLTNNQENASINNEVGKISFWQKILLFFKKIFNL